MRFDFSKRGMVLVVVLALVSVGAIYGQALQRWTWPAHRLSFKVPVGFKVTHTPAQLTATDGKAFSYSLAPSREASRNAKDIAASAFRRHPATDKTLDLEQPMNLANHNGFLMYGTGKSQNRKLHVIVVGFSSKTTPQNLAASFVWWENPANNERFVRLAKDIAESLGSY